MSTAGTAATVDHLTKRFRVFHERHQSLKQAVLNRRRGQYEAFTALDDVTFHVPKGEAFAIVGHNGSGKSTMLKCLTRILRPDGGSVSVEGSVSALLELGAGFHPELSGRENVYLNAAILGVPRKQIAAKFDEIVAFAELEQFIDTPVKNYSSGMYVRLGFAVAVNVDPDVLIVDEVLAVGDAAFQAKCMRKIGEFRERGRTIILVTHALDSASEFAERVAWLDHGKLRMLGAPDEVIAAYAESQLGPGASSKLPTGAVTIEDIGATDVEGRPATRITTGTPLVLRARLRADDGLEPVVVTMSVRGHGGVILAQVSSPPLEPAADGTIEAAYRVPSLPLLAGGYSVFCDVHTADRSVLHAHRAEAMHLEVAAESAAGEGLVSLGGNWV